MVTFARVKDWVNLIKKLKLASVCFPEKKKINTVKLFVFLQVLFSDFCSAARTTIKQTVPKPTSSLLVLFN